MSAAAPLPGENMGRPEPRLDARLKVTGAAHYPADVMVNKPAFAYFVTSSIARGSITAIDSNAARAMPGVIRILTQEDIHGIQDAGFFSTGGAMSSSIRPLASSRIEHDGEIVAVVLAESYEEARAAAYRVKVDYTTEPPSASFDSPGVQIVAAAEVSKEHEDPHVGDAEAALKTADVIIDARYSTPIQHHNPMELFTTTCVWSGDQLTIYEPSQFVYGMKNGVAKSLGISADKVHVVSRYVGGAFGSKGALTHGTILIAYAARLIDRPVKLVPPRSQGFTIKTHRAETQHHIRMGARRDGKIVAYAHEGWEVTSRPDNYKVAGTADTVRVYDYGNVWTKVNLVHADRNTPGFMRSPPVVPYVYALESAIDELAVALSIDPVELRKRNDTMKDPISGKPYSSKSLLKCYEQAAEAFGWSKRQSEVGSMRDGDWLIGWGCATAVYPTHIGVAGARVKLSHKGTAVVQVAAHDVGTGAYTVVGQMAADTLGLPTRSVTVEMGDTQYPPATVAGGSNTTATVCSTVKTSCESIREKLFKAATSNRGPFAGLDVTQLKLEDGHVVAADGRKAALEKVMEGGNSVIEEYTEWTPEGVPADAVKKLYSGKGAMVGGPKGKKLFYAFGAEFVEVRIHSRTKEIRVPRAVGAFAAGHIMNTRTAHSQLMGGMIWGISSALHEATEIDRSAARYVNTNYADYLIPVNADIQSLDIILVPEVDTEVNPAGVKGIGELGNVGTAAAIANAVYHATGRRIRDLPIRLDDLL
jgi:xanthine dehydrogenase YagR molybdenum-binding subunit